MKKIIFTEEQINEIKNFYLEQNYTLKAIGEHYGVSRTVISRILKENLPKEEIRKTTHKFKANYQAFQNIDTAEKAYWLGFIAADGCIYTRKKNASIILNIHEKDTIQLENFKKFLNSDVEILHYIQNNGFSNNTPMVKLVLNSVEMAQDLIDKGITPRKSLTLKPPKIEKKFYLPFILGYFDGDGSISHLANKEFSISFQGTKEMLEWILETLQETAVLEKRNNDEKNSYYIRWGGIHKVYKILSQLYNSTNCYLPRKKEKFLTLEAVVLDRNVK